jgi:hypothetical protein
MLCSELVFYHYWLYSKRKLIHKKWISFPSVFHEPERMPFGDARGGVEGPRSVGVGRALGFVRDLAHSILITYQHPTGLD